MLSAMKPGLFAMLLLLGGSLFAADVPVTPIVSHTNAPVTVSPEQMEIARTFQVKRGFRMEQVANESLVADPVAMAFDENGRLFVLEAGGGEAQPGRVRLLEDKDTNGVFDASSVYADNVASPSALACYGGGLFVGAAGQIIYLKDTNSDGVADLRQDVFKSFGGATNGNGGKVTITSLAWGLDNRIHAATAGMGGDVISSSSPTQSIILSNGNFEFDPRSFALVSESGSGATGMAFDDVGHQFVSSSTRHLQKVMYAAESAGRNPLYEVPPVLNDLTGRGPASFIYAADPKNRVAHYPDGAIRERFTGASGILIYRGGQFPPDYAGDVFVIDTVGNVIHRDKLRVNGVEWLAERPADEQESEFLVVKDNSFQLRQIINGPDGALYLAGVATKPGKTVAGVGLSHGRIYRIVPVNFKQPKRSQLGKATPEQLVLALRHPNGWQRDTAARLLFERQDRSTVVPLIRLLFDVTAPPVGRMQAFCALAGLQITADGRPGRALMEPHVVRALNDSDERVREQGVVVSGRFIAPGGIISDRLWGQLSGMTADPSPQVRYQLTYLLGQIQRPDRAQKLAEILRTDVNSRWLQVAVLSSLGDGAGELFSLLTGDANFRGTQNGGEFIGQLLLMIGERNQRPEVVQTMNLVQKISEPQVAFNLAMTLGNGLQRADNSLTAFDAGGMFTPLYIRAENLAFDLTVDDSTRIAALRLLSSVTNVDTQLTGALGDEWANFQPRFRGEAVLYLLSRYGHTAALVYDVQGGIVPKTDLTSAEIRFLFNYDDADIHQSMILVFGNDQNVSRQTMVNRFQTALQLSGRAARGQQIYQSRCVMCHQLAGEGARLGLSLDAATRMSREMLLTKILDPNRERISNHPLTTVITADFETILGFVARENANSTTFLDAHGVERTVGRLNNLSQKSLGISGMPEGLEAGLNQQDMADLLEFITTDPP